MRLIIVVVATLAVLSSASPVFMQEEPDLPADVVPVEPDIPATIQAAVAGTVQVAVVSTVSTWLTSLPVATATPTAIPATSVPITITGKGRLNSAPFGLQGGNYSISWTATDPPTGFGCFHSGDLKAVDGTPSFMTVGSGVVAKGKTSSGTTQLYNVKPSTYYLAMGSSCEWTVTILPLH